MTDTPDTPTIWPMIGLAPLLDRDDTEIGVVLESLTASDLGRALAACRRRTKKKCDFCHQEFDGLSHGLYCSDRCNWAAYYRRNAVKRRAAQRERSRLKRLQRVAQAGQRSAPASMG